MKDEWSNWNFPDTSHFIHVIKKKKNRGITQNQKYLNVGHNMLYIMHSLACSHLFKTMDVNLKCLDSHFT